MLGIETFLPGLDGASQLSSPTEDSLLEGT